MASTPPESNQTPPAAGATPSPPGGETNTSGVSKSLIISLLYLGGFVTGISGLVGFILALVWQGEVRGTWEESHLQYHVITGIGGLIGFAVGFVLMFVLIGFLVFLLVAIWMLVRSIMPILKAQNQEPMPDPKSWLF